MPRAVLPPRSVAFGACRPQPVFRVALFIAYTRPPLDLDTGPVRRVDELPISLLVVGVLAAVLLAVNELRCGRLSLPRGLRA